MRVLRYGGLFGVLFLVATTFACGGGTSNNGGGGTSGAKVKIALVEHVRVPAVEIFAYGAQAAADELGFQLDITGPQQYNLQQQQAMSDAEANAGAKGIIEILVGATAWSRNETDLMSRGVKVVNIGVYTGPFLANKTPIYVGPNDIDYGRALGNLVVKAIGGASAQGDVVIATCVPGLLEQEDRFNGVRLALSDYAPNVNLLGLFNVSDDPSIGIPQFQQLVQAHPNALAFVGLCSTHPADLAKVRAATPGAKWLVTGGELDPGTLQGIKNGQVYGVVDAAIWQQGYISAKLLYEQNTKSGIPETGWIDSGIETVTSSNVDAVIARENGTRANEYQFFKPQMDKIFANLNGNIKPLSDAHR
ncbi:MAG TPA: substrate-binding domain-containing protein [Candidatus Limnocylindrales bacterium]|nr:substrate-binding domain-containing protein [Candidatus Limnocylindrales bacterium]